MEFEINGRHWRIEEVNQKDLQELKGVELEKDNYFLGLTVYYNQTIFIWNGLHREQKRQTLLHELIHCYIGVYCDFQLDYTNIDEDYLCNISANSHDIIHEIVERYFKKEE